MLNKPRSRLPPQLLITPKYDENLTICKTQEDVVHEHRRNTSYQQRPKQQKYNFQLCHQIGQGQFSRVMLVKNAGIFYALKMIDKKLIQKYNINSQVQREIDIQSAIQHNNIVKCFGNFTDNDYIYLITEYCEKGSLFQKQFSELEIKQIIKQILIGVQYLHQMGIMHRDIKPENIYLTQNNVVKIGDFGFSNYRGTRRKTYCGTPEYMPPEIVMQQKYNNATSGYDERVDIWSIGILVYELYNNTVPFRDCDKLKQQDRIIREEIQFRQNEDPNLIDFVKKCLKKDPYQRATISELLKHVFLQF